MKKSLLLLAIFSHLLSIAQTTKGNRTVAWQIDMAQNGNYDSAFLYAKQACMESVHLFYTWDNIEDSMGQFNSQFMDARLSPADFYYPAFNTKVELQLAPINTGTKTVPKDLMGLKFNNPIVINRFKIFLDTVFNRIPNVEISTLNIGNEHDAYMGGDSIMYVEYQEFLDSVFPYAKQIYAKKHSDKLKTGTTFTYHGLTSFPTAPFCWQVNTSCDIVATTYYPLNSDFTMKPPSVVLPDFKVLVSIYSDTTKPIYFAECGYASSKLCNSSEEQQADFYKNVFMAWDSLQNNIKYITLFKTNDWSRAEVESIAPFYGLGKDTIFKEYLRTLGVRTWEGNGTSKIAYNTILCELNNRNWCTVKCPQLSLENITEYPKPYLFPNPVKDQLNIITKSKMSNVKVYNEIGVLVLKSDKNSFEVLSLTSGLYFIQFENVEGEINTLRFVKN